ncbi:MAG: YitT family protein [Oscillospiraceae bacterium]|nr:YitT family protein [Oscillospiraceae bacterium]
MKNITKDSVKKFVLLNFGLFLTAVGICLFKTPNHFAIGGTSGLAIILANLFPRLNVGSAMFAINMVLVVLGFIFIGKQFAGATVFASFALSFYVSVIEYVMPMASPFTNDTLLELIYAILLPGIGSAIVFNIGASTGGTDIIAMILKKYIKMEIGKALLISDFLITVWAGAIFGIRTGLYCVLGLFVKAYLVDIAIESFNTRKYLTIISGHAEEIKDYILKTLHRGANISTAYGAYTGEERQVITTVLTGRQAVELRNFIRKIDPAAFLTIVNSSETIGKGFRQI